MCVGDEDPIDHRRLDHATLKLHLRMQVNASDVTFENKWRLDISHTGAREVRNSFLRGFAHVK